MNKEKRSLDLRLQSLNLKIENLNRLGTEEEKIECVKRAANSKLQKVHPDVCDKNISPTIAKRTTQEVLNARDYVINAIKAEKTLSEKEFADQMDEAIEIVAEKRKRERERREQEAIIKAAKRAEEEKRQQTVSGQTNKKRVSKRIQQSRGPLRRLIDIIKGDLKAPYTDFHGDSKNKNGRAR